MTAAGGGRIGVMFVCLGNICRSPMAEFVFADMTKKAGLADSFRIASSATSGEAEGCPVHRGTLAKMREEGIPVYPREAVRLTAADADAYDYFLGMDSRNVASMRRILGKKAEGRIYRLTDFCRAPRDIADPWYTGDFEVTYRDVSDGCAAFLDRLREEGKVL